MASNPLTVDMCPLCFAVPGDPSGRNPLVTDCNHRWHTQDKHHMFCSAAGWPCPLHCERWTRCAMRFFPVLPDPEFLCPTCQGGPCTLPIDA